MMQKSSGSRGREPVRGLGADNRLSSRQELGDANRAGDNGGVEPPGKVLGIWECGPAEGSQAKATAAPLGRSSPSHRSNLGHCNVAEGSVLDSTAIGGPDLG